MILDYGSWFDNRGSWSNGPMVVGGGNNGLMVDDYAPMGMGRGSNGSMVVVLVTVGHGSLIY